MTKTVRPAISAFLQSYKQNWRNLSLLAIKAYALTHLISVMLYLFTDKVFGTALMAKLKIYYEMIFGFLAFQSFNMPSQTLIQQTHNDTIVEIIMGLISAWLTAPLFTSICRTMVLGEKFDTSFVKRLTQGRCLKVALVSCVITIILYSSITFILDTSDDRLWVSLASCIYYLFVYYITLRVYYLIPAIAVDNMPTSFAQGWTLTRKKTWAIFKITLLVLLSYVVATGVIALIMQKMISIPIDTWVAILIWTVTSGIFFIFFMPLLLGGVASMYRSSQKSK